MPISLSIAPVLLDTPPRMLPVNWRHLDIPTYAIMRRGSLVGLELVCRHRQNMITRSEWYSGESRATETSAVGKGQAAKHEPNPYELSAPPVRRITVNMLEVKVLNNKGLANRL